MMKEHHNNKTKVFAKKKKQSNPNVFNYSLLFVMIKNFILHWHHVFAALSLTGLVVQSTEGSFILRQSFLN